MDEITQGLVMLRSGMLVVLLALGGAVLFHFLNKRLGAPGGPAFVALLAGSLCTVGLLLFCLRFTVHMHLGNRAIVFIALYAWCVGTMLFFARQTHRLKLLLALALLAGMLYRLFLWQ